MPKRVNKDCLWNIGVECGDPDCRRCGWNPQVIETRKEAIRQGPAVVRFVVPAKPPEPREKWYIGSGEFPRCHRMS